MTFPRIREMCNFTTHTPVEAGQDRFPYELVRRMLGDIIDPDVLRRLGGDDKLNMTRIALNLSEYVNGVAKAHAEVSSNMFPGYVVHAITNGVHPKTWTCPSFAALYDRHLPGWYHEPELLDARRMLHRRRRDLGSAHAGETGAARPGRGALRPSNWTPICRSSASPGA